MEVANVLKSQFSFDFFVHVVENNSLNGHHFAADHRIRQIELDEKRTEDLQLENRWKRNCYKQFTECVNDSLYFGGLFNDTQAVECIEREGRNDP